jgi:hypothetical protein
MAKVKFRLKNAQEPEKLVNSSLENNTSNYFVPASINNVDCDNN